MENLKAHTRKKTCVLIIDVYSMRLDTMAETNARREARRRRILENSENRLRKITARNNPNETEDNNPLVESDGIKTKSSLEECNIINGTCNVGNKAEKLQDYTRFNNDEHERFLDTSTTSDKDTCLPDTKQISNVEFILCTLLANRISLILLAGIVNILFVLKLDDWFGQAVLIPYSLLMLGRLYSCKKLHKIQDGSLLVAALMLCNIKPDLIYRFKVLYALFNIVLDDFSLYMFSFVLMRYIIICYYYYVPLSA